MKKFLKQLAFAGLAVFAAYGAANAAQANPCIIIAEMQNVFKTLRTLAFVGAGFCIAGWAWGYITGGGDKAMDNLKKQGLGLLIGFTLLFSVGIILQFLPNIANCALTGW